jgi:hypothetical protein
LLPKKPLNLLKIIMGAFESLMFPKEKHDEKIKGGACADGRKQHE